MTLKLGAFLLYSSVASAFGNVGQGTYAAANHALELSCTRRAHGLSACGMQLPMVMDAGMGAAFVDPTRLNFKGMAAIALDEYAACISMLLDQQSKLGAMQVPLPTEMLLESAADSSQRVYEELVATRPLAQEQDMCMGVQTASGTFGQEIAQAAPALRQQLVEAMVVREVAELAQGATEATTPLMEAGIDSLATTELASSCANAGIRAANAARGGDALARAQRPAHILAAYARCRGLRGRHAFERHCA
jgi:hypothetical protein